MDAYHDGELFVNEYQQPLTTIRVPEKQLVSEIDLEKLELLKVIESQR